MISKLLRRSGVAVALFAERIGWRPDTVYQVGVGQYYEEVKVMKEAWPDTVFVGVEPVPEVAAELQKNYPGAIYETAIYDYQGVAPFYVKPKHKDGSSLHPHDDMEGVRIILVQLHTLDSRFGYPPTRHTLLWLDCEGSELQVLQGGRGKFLRRVEVINIELTSKPPGRGWCDHGEVHAWMNKHGFYRQWMHTQRGGSGQTDAIYVRHNLFRPELCCCPCQTELWQTKEALTGDV